METTVQIWTVHVTRGEYAGRIYTFKSAAAARRKRDRLDYQYGAVCSHIVIPRAEFCAV